MESNKIRRAFLDFFESKGHVIVPSAPMVVKGDPTLMFTNAGMNQFKDIFLGNAPRKYPRAADTQKCLRVSGKHDDLEEVGHDTLSPHDVRDAGQLVLRRLLREGGDRVGVGAAGRRLRTARPTACTPRFFEGSEEDGVPFDQEAYDYWKQFLPEDHIIRGNKHDNFWEMGETGPCGPCSEIHFDLRDEAEIAAKPGREMVDAGHPQVIEIWNLVFMQFNRKADGWLEPLPARNVDTGMGFERLCMILQGKKSDYDTDVFQPTIQAYFAAVGQGLRRRRQVRRGDARHRRPPARHRLFDRRRPAAVERQGRLRHPPHPAPRRALRLCLPRLLRSRRSASSLPDWSGAGGGAVPRTEGPSSTLIEKVIEEEEASFLRTLATGEYDLLDGVIEKTKGEEPGADFGQGAPSNSTIRSASRST